MKHKHRWKFSGIISAGHRLGMSHRRCICMAELYEPATKAELRKHDPQGDVQKALDKLAQN